jgi:uncharacterized membrane protein YeiB
VPALDLEGKHLDQGHKPAASVDRMRSPRSCSHVAHSSYRRFQDDLTGTRLTATAGPAFQSDGWFHRAEQSATTHQSASICNCREQENKSSQIWVPVTQPWPPRLLSVGGRAGNRTRANMWFQLVASRLLHSMAAAPPLSAVASHFMPVILVMSIPSALLAITEPGQITSSAGWPDSYLLYISYTTADAAAFMAPTPD